MTTHGWNLPLEFWTEIKKICINWQKSPNIKIVQNHGQKEGWWGDVEKVTSVSWFTVKAGGAPSWKQSCGKEALKSFGECPPFPELCSQNPRGFTETCVQSLLLPPALQASLVKLSFSCSSVTHGGLCSCAQPQPRVTAQLAPLAPKQL